MAKLSGQLHPFGHNIETIEVAFGQAVLKEAAHVPARGTAEVEDALFGREHFALGRKIGQHRVTARRPILAKHFGLAVIHKEL